MLLAQEAHPIDHLPRAIRGVVDAPAEALVLALQLGDPRVGRGAGRGAGCRMRRSVRRGHLRLRCLEAGLGLEGAAAKARQLLAEGGNELLELAKRRRGVGRARVGCVRRLTSRCVA